MGAEVVILVDGRDFIDLVREWELPMAARVGEADIAGATPGSRTGTPDISTPPSP